MFSGGIDSTYVLWDRLARSNDTVVAHHIILANREGRALPEARACGAIVEWLKRNVRDFVYSESAVDRRNLTHFFGYDMLVVGFEAGLAAQNFRMARNRPVDHWVIGNCLDEGGGWTGRWQHVDNACAAASFPFDPPQYFDLPVVTKLEQVEAMPKDLVALTWECRRPVWRSDMARPCGRCKTCTDRRRLGLS